MPVAADTLKLLASFKIVIEANKGTPSDPDERVLDAEGLALKSFIHATSCFYLQRSTMVRELQASFFDLASMNVLARATIESFLVFHYVFAAPSTDEEREFRHLSWVLADLLERQEIPATLPENQAKQRDELKEIEAIIVRLKNNPAFQKLSPKRQVAVLEKKQWRFQAWTAIAQDAGLSQLHAAFAYRHLCSYAHSGSLSVLQVRQATTRADQLFLSEMSLRLVNVAVAFMVNAYGTMFPAGHHALSGNKDLNHTVKEWMRLGATA